MDKWDECKADKAGVRVIPDLARGFEVFAELGQVYFSSQEARDLAAVLLAAADEADRRIAVKTEQDIEDLRKASPDTWDGIPSRDMSAIIAALRAAGWRSGF